MVSYGTDLRVNIHFSMFYVRGPVVPSILNLNIIYLHHFCEKKKNISADVGIKAE